MSGFEIIDHTADVGIHAHGDTLAEAFAQAATGMFSIMSNLERIQEQESREVEVDAPDTEALLVAWMNELIYLSSVGGLLFRRFKVLEMDETRIRARCHGERFDQSRHQMLTEVKAATYHMLDVKKRDDGWHARVILDI